MSRIERSEENHKICKIVQACLRKLRNLRKWRKERYFARLLTKIDKEQWALNDENDENCKISEFYANPLRKLENLQI